MVPVLSSVRLSLPVGPSISAGARARAPVSPLLLRPLPVRLAAPLEKSEETLNPRRCAGGGGGDDAVPLRQKANATVR